MTNGEKIKATFPHYDIEIDEHKGYVRVFYEDFYTTYPLRWWNAEYKEPVIRDVALPPMPYAEPDNCGNYIEQTTMSDLGVDCISRTDAIQAMQDKAKKLTNEDTINGLCGAVAILFDLPSVTLQESKTGHWIDSSNGWMCSECHKDNTFETNYCPNCGAKMIEPQESEE